MLKQLLTTRQKQKIKLLFAKNLDDMARICGTNKLEVQNFTRHYDAHFQTLRNQPVTLLEIGIGGWDDAKGYADSAKGGESLRMWKAYFPKGRIYGIDIEDKRPHEEKRIKTFQGSQDDADFLEKVIAETGPPDIIVDDGSHFTDHIIKSFEILFPLLKSGGIYAIEDLQTSYWTEYNGSEDLNAPHTSMNYLKRLTDGINHKEFRTGYEPNYFEKNIESLHFYQNLCVIYKT